MTTTSSPLSFNGGSPLPYQEEHPAACQLPIGVASPPPLAMMGSCSSMGSSASSATCSINTCGDPSPRKRPRTLQSLSLPLQNRSCSTPKERFAAFVTILLMQLDGKGVQERDYKLSIQAKALIAECIRRAEMKDPHFCPLEKNMAERLRALVGDYHWNRAQAHLQFYLAKHHGQVPPTPNEMMLDVGLCQSLNTSNGDAQSSLPLINNLTFGAAPLSLPPR